MDNGGDFSKKAIVIMARTEKEGIKAEYEYIGRLFCEEGVTWERQSQKLLRDGSGKVYDVLTVLLSDGRTREFVFDITSFFGQTGNPELDARVAEIVSKHWSPELEAAFARIAATGDHPVINAGIDWKKSGSAEEQIKALEETARLRPEDGRAQYNLADAYVVADRYPEAIEALRRAIKASPYFFEANYTLGYLLIQLERFQEGLQPLQRAVEIRSDHIHAQKLLGIVYGELKNYPVALEIFEKLARITPEDSEIHFFIGQTYWALDRPQEAVPAYQRAIELDPGHAHAHFYLGLSQLMLGNRFAALEEHRILKTLDHALADELFKSIYP